MDSSHVWYHVFFVAQQSFAFCLLLNCCCLHFGVLLVLDFFLSCCLLHSEIHRRCCCFFFFLQCCCSSATEWNNEQNNNNSDDDDDNDTIAINNVKRKNGKSTMPTIIIYTQLGQLRVVKERSCSCLLLLWFFGFGVYVCEVGEAANLASR